ncbi:MAG: MopE-related protein [Pseudomonadota bacterium]
MRPAPLLVASLALAACEQDFDVHRVKAALDVAPRVMDLGTVPVGSETPFTMQVLNAEGSTVTLTTVEVANQAGAWFALTTAELPEVPEGGSATLDFLYAPAEEGWHWADVTVGAGDAADDVLVQVRGRAGGAAASVYPGLLDFGPVASREQAEGVLHLVNEGLVPISLEAMDLTPRSFSLLSALPISVEPGAEALLTLAFSPRDEEPATGTADFTLDLPEVELGTVTLVANDCLNGDATLYDVDGDGWAACGTDCDDTSAATHPGADEVCDGADNDCDGTTDEGTSCYDDDGDGQTEDDGDCNDGDPSIYFGAPEDYTNGIDDDCDGVVDSSFVDNDCDGYAVEGGDCDDADATAHPGAAEAADSVDNDCDGTVDEGTRAYDDDGDGHTETGGDCDDADASTYPYAPELADWVDNDCDGSLDEGTVNADDDGDGYTETGGDCDDASARVNPSATEIVGDGVDNDCDGVTR